MVVFIGTFCWQIISIIKIDNNYQLMERWIISHFFMYTYVSTYFMSCNRNSVPMTFRTCTVRTLKIKPKHLIKRCVLPFQLVLFRAFYALLAFSYVRNKQFHRRYEMHNQRNVFIYRSTAEKTQFEEIELLFILKESDFCDTFLSWTIIMQNHCVAMCNLYALTLASNRCSTIWCGLH